MIPQNSIFNNNEALVHLDSSVVPSAPIIDAADLTFAEGSCEGMSVDWVEVFADRWDQGERFLGSSPCEAGAWHVDFESPVIVGLNLTATGDGADQPLLRALPALTPLHLSHFQKKEKSL